MAEYKRFRALQLLRLGSGLPQAEFREGQEKAIKDVVENRGRLLAIQRTGWGKSFVYFIAIKLLREEGHGLALLVSPLLALMRNQIAAAKRMGVRAETINSDNTENWSEIEAAVRADNLDILLISPERLANVRFVERVLATIGNRVSLLVIDEAHCISDWGHDFRPHYRLIERVAFDLPRNMRLLGNHGHGKQSRGQRFERCVGAQSTYLPRRFAPHFIDLAGDSDAKPSGAPCLAGGASPGV